MHKMFSKSLLFTLAIALATPALAWVPKLEESTAQNVIDGVYGRRTPVPTYHTIDLKVKDGQFVAGKDAIKAQDGGPECVANWLSNPQDLSKGSRISSVTVSGQADQLYFQAVAARDSFKSLTVKDALGEKMTKQRSIGEGELRVDMNITGLPTKEMRRAYLVRLKTPNGKLIAPARISYVDNWKLVNATGANTPTTETKAATPAKTAPATDTPQPPTETEGTKPPAQTASATTPATSQGPWKVTLVYYFKPLDEGMSASAKPELLVRTEQPNTTCAYNIPLDLSKFQ